MVKLEAVNSLSSSMDDSEILNANGKREAGTTDLSSKKRLKSKSLYRQPTANELNRLQETENLFNSNLFRLQIEEVINEVQVSEKTTKKFQEWFASLKAYLLSIPEDNTLYDLTESTFTKKYKVKLPLSNELIKTKCVFCFHKFEDVNIVGSFVLGCAINSKLQVDLSITVPPVTYTKNDSLNYRYHKKRGAYLACIASHLNKADLVERIQYSFLKGCETKPRLLITPKGKLSKYVSVCLNLVCGMEAYKLHRLSPARNNLREHWLCSTNNNDNVSEGGPPTPYYNHSVLCDLTSNINYNFLQHTLGQCDNLKQAIILLKIWIRQRKLQVAGHIVSLFVAYLVKNKRINNIMSSYQIVRNVWISLSSSEWDVRGITLHPESDATPSIEEFHQQCAVVFVDITGYYNFCWQMSRGTYLALKAESSHAVQLLDNAKINSFIPLFMTSFEPLLQYDHIVRFRDVPQLITSVVEKTPTDVRLNYGVDHLALVVDVLHTMFTKGLGARADLITEILHADFTWDVTKTPEKAKLEGYNQSFSFGLVLNPENAISLVDKGPQANLPEAEKFREFWGEKSELRRFQDGSITEACVWSGDDLLQRRAIPRQVLDHLLRRHYGVGALFHVGAQLDALLRGRAVRGRGRALHLAALDALRGLDDLRRLLRDLTDLPLPITAVNGTSAVLSYSCPAPPGPAAPPRAPTRGPAALACLQRGAPPPYVPVVDAVIELGHSGKWPGSLEALRCVKAAFHAQIAERLRRQCGLRAAAAPGHVAARLRGRVYRLRVAHGKERTLLRRTPPAERLLRDTQLLPRVRGALHGLCSRCPLLGDTSVVLQRWAAAHLLSGLVPPLALQLLAAAACAGAAGAAGAPGGVLRGLVGALRLIADTDWASTVLVVDLNQELTRSEARALEQRVLQLEARPALALATALDGELVSAWTRRRPSRPVLRRMQQLAASTLRHLDRRLLHHMDDHVLGAFVPSYEGYDAVIHLQAGMVARRHERLDVQPRPAAGDDRDDELDDEGPLPVLEFDLVHRYVQELISVYGELAVFFYDEFGGEVVAVLWKPDIRQRKPFQVGSCLASEPLTENGETTYRVNLEAVLEDFRILGRGLVTHITHNSK